MTNKAMIDRVLKAYRPLYLQGLLVDGQYRLPTTAAKPESARPKRHMLLVALAGLRQTIASTGNKP